MAQSGVNLVSLFNTVSKVMNQNQDSLNQADNYNHDHGDHMAETFQVIAQAMKEKQNAEPADQLAYASELLRQQTSSGSSQVYASNLAQAASQLQGQPSITADNAMQLVQSLLGGAGQAQSQGGGDLLGSVLSGLGGASQTGEQSAGAAVNPADLLSAGMSFFGAKQRGASTGEALIGALLGGSQLNDGAHRQQSGELVANTLLQSLGSLLGGAGK